MRSPTEPARRRPQLAAPISSRKPPPAPRGARPTVRPFPIVAIGASAGGLDALERFLRQVPAGSGMAFVVVQHLDPTHEGMLAEILQRATSMTVAQVRDRTRVHPDRVYVIPPNKDMSILHGVLHLLDPVARHGLRLPIDFFFRALADDWEERSIGVVLSGMGTDGTLGLRAIKGKAGAVFVQDPASAKFDGMPRSAIAAGLADVVASPDELPGKILAYLNHSPLLSPGGPEAADVGHSAFEKVVILLRTQTGHDFSLYKRNTVYRRIERRMGIHQIRQIDDYVRFLQENAQELDLLFKELLIGVTSFFRDPAGWEALAADVIPGLLTERPPGQALRAWVAGCSTGEEAYSLAMVFAEALDRLKRPRIHSLQIFATDLNHDAIDRARAGKYPDSITADVSPERLSRYFAPVEQGYQVCPSIREMVIFAPQNLVMDPPFTKLDLLLCRNLLIYLTPELQKKLLPLFHYSLNPGGWLFLGTAEAVGTHTHLFAPLAGKVRLFRRIEAGTTAAQVDFPSAIRRRGRFEPAAPAPGLPVNIQAQAEQLLLKRYAPAAVLVTAMGDVVFVSGRTGQYLEPAAGKANWNIFAMAREGLRHPLQTAFDQALELDAAVTRSRVTVATDGGVLAVDLRVQAIREPGALQGMVLVDFTDAAVPAAPGASARMTRPTTSARAQKREDARRESSADRQRMQTLQEELRSANEELQSSNEELQSTNEELTTSKEEMQSMNEELQTLNRELEAKVDEFSGLASDMKNLLDSTEIATVFLDTAMRVRLFTLGSNRIFKLIQGDVGRPLADIASGLDYPALLDDAREVLRALATHERQAAARDGRWFLVRIMPYRTIENVIAGVVITFSDITAAKSLEADLRHVQVGMERHIAEQDVKLEQVEGERASPPHATPARKA